MSRPCAVVVSAQASASDLKPDPALPIVSRILSKSRFESGEPIEPRNHEHVALAEPPPLFLVARAKKAAAVGFPSYTSIHVVVIEFMRRSLPSLAPADCPLGDAASLRASAPVDVL